jgi:hypothetical protein
MTDQSRSPCGCKEAERETGRGQGQYILQRLVHSYLLPLASSYLLKFLPVSVIVLQARDQDFNAGACGGHFIFKPQHLNQTKIPTHWALVKLPILFVYHGGGLWLEIS